MSEYVVTGGKNEGAGFRPITGRKLFLYQRTDLRTGQRYKRYLEFFVLTKNNAAETRISAKK